MKKEYTPSPQEYKDAEENLSKTERIASLAMEQDFKKIDQELFRKCSFNKTEHTYSPQSNFHVYATVGNIDGSDVEFIHRRVDSEFQDAYIEKSWNQYEIITENEKIIGDEARKIFNKYERIMEMHNRFRPGEDFYMHSAKEEIAEKENEQLETQQEEVQRQKIEKLSNKLLNL